MKLTLKIGAVILAAAVLLSGCAFSRNALIGSWKITETGLIMTFTQDGLLRLTPPLPTDGSAPSASGQVYYRFLDDSTITLIPASAFNMSENQPIPFTIQGNSMTLDLNGQQVAMERVP